MSRAAALAGAGLCLGAAAAFGWQRTDAPSTPPAVAATASQGVDAASVASIDGAVVFRVKGCAACHARAGSTPMYDLGYPDLTHAAEWAGARRSGLTAEAYVRESIRDPSAFLSPAFRGGSPSPMPVLALSDRDVDALVEYVLDR